MSATPAEPESSTEPAPKSTLASLVFGLGMLAILGVLALRRLDDFDLPWHLANGQLILAAHALPKVDDLSFTHGAVRYLEPISDVLYAVVLRATGAIGLQLLGAIVSVAMLATLWWRTRARGPIAPVVVALTAGATYPFLYVRPATISMLLLAVAMGAVEWHRREPASKSAQRALMTLIPLQWVWANTHGFAPFGAYLAIAYAGYRTLARVVDGRLGEWLPREQGRDWPRAIVVAALATLATTLSRGGARLLLGRDRFGEDLTDITDWTPTTLSLLRATTPAMIALLALLLAALGFGRHPETRRRAPAPWDLIVSAISISLVFQAIRFVPFGAVLIAPIVIDRLAVFVRPTRLMSIVCATSSWVAAIVVAIAIESLLGVGWQPSFFPERAVQWIERARPAGNMWNFMAYGGYLELRLYPAYRAFNDGRNTLVRDTSIVTRARQSMTDDSVFDGLVADFSMQWALTCSMPGTVFNAPLSTKPGWRMVFLDDVAAIYVRDEGPNAALARDGYRVLHHLVTPRGSYELVMGTAKGDARLSQDLAHDGALAAEQAPTSARALQFAAIGAFAVRDRDAFDRASKSLDVIAPNDPGVGELRSRWGEARGW
ncbi:MAG: hypothetical protein ACHREM_07685 [Polyangiales bacterium]